MTKALILFSGGLDSTVTLAEALHVGCECECLFMRHGQRNLKPELKAAKAIAKHYEVKLTEYGLDLSFLAPLPLLGNGNIETGRSVETICSEIPSTYVPCRNAMFLTVASAYAERWDFDEIWVGFNYNDMKGVPVPDGRLVFLQAMELAVALGSKRGVEGRQIHFYAPLCELSKKGVVVRARSLKVPIIMTRTCFSDTVEPCGECDACAIREGALCERRFF